MDLGSPQHSALISLLSRVDFSDAEFPDTAPNVTQEHAHSPVHVEVDVALRYEDGMQIIWDVVTREIAVIFRGAVFSAPHRFDTREEGIAWGEAACKDAGWDENAFEE
jgi:hypothetical protein